MNFYKLYQLLNEYGQTLIQNLIKKFQEEEPTLNPATIRSYIERFERIKNNLGEKDITKYSWKELENTVDSYQPKQRIKAGKLDPTVSDANLLYNQNNVRIYLGKDKKSCVKYSNGYTFCIGARGADNMYSFYRIDKKGTPYFIFNDNLPKENPDHILVLIVYDLGSQPEPHRNRYSITNTQNKGEQFYKNIKDIVRSYPWTKPITNFVDETKGTVEIEPLETLENDLSYELSYMKEDYFIDLDIPDSSLSSLAINDLFKDCSTQEYEDFLNNKSNVAIVHVFSSGYGWYDDKEDDFALFYKNEDDILKELKKRSINYVGNDFIIDGSYEKVKEDIKNALNFSSINNKLTGRPENFVVGQDGVFGVFGKSSYRDGYVVKIFSIPRELILDKNKLQTSELNEHKLKYNKAINWIRNQNREKLKEIIDSYKSNNRIPLVDFIINFMKV